MKTKSIISIFLAILLCFGANLGKAAYGDCICPSETINASEVRATLSNAIKVLCAHCGHTSNCCFSQVDVPVLGSLHLSQVECSEDLTNVAPGTFVWGSISSAVLARTGVNKAPPPAHQPTLLSLHQQLLI